MNQALFPTSRSLSGSSITWADHDEAARLKRLWGLLGLFSLYAAALLVVVAVSDGADVGCILGGIAGHVLYATHRIVSSWRDAAWLEDAKARAVMRSRVLAQRRA